MIRGSRRRHVADLPVAMTALLVQPAERSPRPLQTLEGTQRVRDSPKAALSERSEIEQVAILRKFLEQRGRGIEHLGVRLSLDLHPQLAQRSLDAARRSGLTGAHEQRSSVRCLRTGS